MAQKLGGGGGTNGFRGRFTIESKSDINVTPLVDVMLVLLIIFMAAVPVATTSLKLDMPPVNPGTPQPDPPKPIYISLTEDGTIYLVDRKTTLEALPADVSAAMTARDGTPFSQPVYIRADSEVRYERFMEVMDRLRATGFKKVSLISEDIA